MSVAVEQSPVDFTAIKTRQQATWASGNYSLIGSTLQIVGESLVETADIRAGERVLDVAAGNGNVSLAAARRFADVTSTDYVPALLDNGRRRAEADGLAMTFQVADAEALPFPDGMFDVVVSTFGVMFTPEPARAAKELARVTRSGGRIALANWTLPSFIGQLFGVLGRHVPPPAGVGSPARWGSRQFVESLFGDAITALRFEPRTYSFHYRSAAHFLEMFRTYYGPTHKAFNALDADRAAALTADITALLDQHNIGGTQSLVVPSEYVEIVATKR